MSGEFDIHSLEFYKLMAQAKADLDKNGAVDTDEERSIFNDYMARFERDGQKGITNEDVFIYRGEVTNTDEDRAKEQRQKELNEHYKELSMQDRVELLDLLHWYNAKTERVLDFREDANDTLEYLNELNLKRLSKLAMNDNGGEIDFSEVDFNNNIINRYTESYVKYYPPKTDNDSE